MNKYNDPMSAVEALTKFLNDLEEDSVKAQILEIYLEDNENIRKIVIKNLKLDGLL
jgi:hypothetical protein